MEQELTKRVRRGLEPKKGPQNPWQTLAREAEKVMNKVARRSKEGILEVETTEEAVGTTARGRHGREKETIRRRLIKAINQKRLTMYG